MKHLKTTFKHQTKEVHRRTKEDRGSKPHFFICAANGDSGSCCPNQWSIPEDAASKNATSGKPQSSLRHSPVWPSSAWDCGADSAHLRSEHSADPWLSRQSYRCAPKEQPHAEQSLAVRTRHTQKQLFHKTNVARLQYFFLLTQMQVSIVLFYFTCHAGYYARKPVCCLCCCAAVKPAPMKEPMKLFSVEKRCASSASTSGEFWELCWVNGHSNCQERYSSPIVLTDAAVKNIRYRYFESFIWHYCQMSRLLLT